MRIRAELRNKTVGKERSILTTFSQLSDTSECLALASTHSPLKLHFDADAAGLAADHFSLIFPLIRALYCRTSSKFRFLLAAVRQGLKMHESSDILVGARLTDGRIGHSLGTA
ncbi:unnamed protein product [Protopolystoma xenopodis]|uniref:Uncharacterized protein n=1 Tax=Protopolystoma xenopodis TaxID=117903 RepID=A0A3S5AKX3_9PLAT|nr:unnamed protein product [Protopolystoma xenopodis]